MIKQNILTCPVIFLKRSLLALSILFPFVPLVAIFSSNFCKSATLIFGICCMISMTTWNLGRSISYTWQPNVVKEAWNKQEPSITQVPFSYHLNSYLIRIMLAMNLERLQHCNHQITCQAGIQYLLTGHIPHHGTHQQCRL